MGGKDNPPPPLATERTPPHTHIHTQECVCCEGVYLNPGLDTFPPLPLRQSSCRSTLCLPSAVLQPIQLVLLFCLCFLFLAIIKKHIPHPSPENTIVKIYPFHGRWNIFFKKKYLLPILTRPNLTLAPKFLIHTEFWYQIYISKI